MAEIGRRDRTPVRDVVVGALVFLVGALTIGVLIFINNSRDPAAVKVMMDLGLAGSAMVSATAQLLVFLGGWLIWRGMRRRRR